MIDRRLLIHFDWFLLLITFLLVGTGIVCIYSAATGTTLYTRQFYWAIVGTVIMTLVFMTDYANIEKLAYIIYGISILLLILVLIVGRTTGGAQRWLDLGIVSFQPSEFAKIALIIALAKYFSTKEIGINGLGIKGLIPPALLLILPFLLIAKEPDLGTALTLLLIFSSIALLIKINTKTLIGLATAFLLLAPLAWNYLLKDYQKKRIYSFIDPSYDQFGGGYHLMQSKIAIGSGGFLGKGFMQGTQGKLLYLPERHTDFIFSIFAEEWGFVGSFIIMGLYLLLITWGLNIAREAKDRFGALLAFGVVSLFFWHIVINLGMVTGMLPVVGAPLPFLSYGGSFLVITMAGIGILLNVSMRRYIF